MKTEIVGVYEIPGHPDVHAIEALVQAPPDKVDIGKFAQEAPGQPRDNWQVAYDERYLSEDGATVLGWSAPEGMPATRVTFFLHFLDFHLPLLTPGGSLRLPQPGTLPERLRGRITYEPPG